MTYKHAVGKNNERSDISELLSIFERIKPHAYPVTFSSFPFPSLSRLALAHTQTLRHQNSSTIVLLPGYPIYFNAQSNTAFPSSYPISLSCWNSPFPACTVPGFLPLTSSRFSSHCFNCLLFFLFLQPCLLKTCLHAHSFCGCCPVTPGQVTWPFPSSVLRPGSHYKDTQRLQSAKRCETLSRFLWTFCFTQRHFKIKHLKLIKRWGEKK